MQPLGSTYSYHLFCQTVMGEFTSKPLLLYCFNKRGSLAAVVFCKGKRADFIDIKSQGPQQRRSKPKQKQPKNNVVHPKTGLNFEIRGSWTGAWESFLKDFIRGNGIVKCGNVASLQDRQGLFLQSRAERFLLDTAAAPAAQGAAFATGSSEAQNGSTGCNGHGAHSWNQRS